MSSKRLEKSCISKKKKATTYAQVKIYSKSNHTAPVTLSYELCLPKKRGVKRFLNNRYGVMMKAIFLCKVYCFESADAVAEVLLALKHAMRSVKQFIREQSGAFGEFYRLFNSIAVLRTKKEQS
ncbi:hypothetical protein Y032_0115g492 [Ancylostoma ceylanicum]|uniref:Uncharacterized protein n=1 Tax=Ancylostoma ceylanicum TaxID=53326 RepID=A0A016TCW4_9BILA|nr:hypothetical protein Y032_0115g492 [Ancylostoma ceylanicum]